jgi:hypothetical protein
MNIESNKNQRQGRKDQLDGRKDQVEGKKGSICRKVRIRWQVEEGSGGKEGRFK